MLHKENLVHTLFLAIIFVGGTTLLVLYLQALMWSPYLLRSLN